MTTSRHHPGVTRWDQFREAGAFFRFHSRYAKASGEKLAVLNARADPNILCLDGIRVDTVELVLKSPPPECYEPGEDGLLYLFPPVMNECIQPEYLGKSWAEMFEEKTEHVSGGDFIDAYTFTVTAGRRHNYDMITSEEILAAHRADFASSLLKWSEHNNDAGVHKGIPIGDIGLESAIRREAAKGNWADFSTAVMRGWGGRPFFVTSKGYMGLGNVNMRSGDICVVLFGGRVPFVLRPKNGRFLLLGECLIQGLLEGQAITSAERGHLKQETFEIV